MAAKYSAYHSVFFSILSALPAGARMDYRLLIANASLPNAKDQTKKKHLKTFIYQNPAYLNNLTGFYPTPDTIIDLVEKSIGKVMETNLDLANQQCRNVVSGLAQPILEDFISGGLGNHINPTSKVVSMPLPVLTQFLMDDFTEFLKGSGNGLVSIAGKINELLLVRAMKNFGLVEKTNFSITGTDSEADLIIHSTAGNKENLGVEVKSYHARERLLRGLTDVKVPKIGVGYFKDPSEFNPQRTMTLHQAQPAAIYMPQATLSRVDPSSRNSTTTQKAAPGSRLYRPLEQFVTDMNGFVSNGVLPHY